METHRSSTSSPEELASQRELLGRMERSLDALPEPYRVVFMLRDVEGMTTGECAEALGVSEDVVKTRLHRAKGLLRERLASAMEESAGQVFAFHAPRCDRVVGRVLAALRAR